MVSDLDRGAKTCGGAREGPIGDLSYVALGLDAGGVRRTVFHLLIKHPREDAISNSF